MFFYKTNTISMKTKQSASPTFQVCRALTSSGNSEGWKEATNAHRWTQTCWYKVTDTTACSLPPTPCKQAVRDSSPEHLSKL